MLDKKLQPPVPRIAIKPLLCQLSTATLLLCIMLGASACGIRKPPLAETEIAKPQYPPR